MPRNRSKSRNSRSTNDPINTNDNNNHEVNGTTSVANNVLDGNRKRRREDSDDVVVPPKKINNTVSPKRTQKRRMENNDDCNAVKKVKYAQKSYLWKSIIPSDDKERLIIASYNVDLYLNEISDGVIDKDFVGIFLKEIKSINPDVICFQNVKRDLWHDSLVDNLVAFGYNFDFVAINTFTFYNITLYKRSIEKLDSETDKLTSITKKFLEVFFRNPKEHMPNIQNVLEKLENYQITVLRTNKFQIERIYIIANTHLSNENEYGLNFLQACALFCEVKDKIELWKSKLIDSYHHGDNKVIDVTNPTAVSKDSKNHQIKNDNIDFTNNNTLPKLNCNMSNNQNCKQPINQVTWLVCGNFNHRYLQDICVTGFTNDETIMYLRNLPHSLFNKFCQAFMHTLDFNSSPYFNSDNQVCGSYICHDLNNLNPTRIIQCTVDDILPNGAICEFSMG